jgi:hypothetical protein
MSARTITGAIALALLLAGCGKGAGSTSIANGGVVYRNDEVSLHVLGEPTAVIEASGDLVIDGKAVNVDAAQRATLLGYREAVVDIRHQGIEAGKHGARLAADSIKSAVHSITGKDDSESDKAVEARSALVEQTGNRICLDVVAMKAAQDTLAAQLPDFRPYAHIIGDNDHEKCDDKADHAAP